MAPPHAETTEIVQEFKDLDLKELAKGGAYTVYPEKKVYFRSTTFSLPHHLYAISRMTVSQP